MVFYNNYFKNLKKNYQNLNKIKNDRKYIGTTKLKKILIQKLLLCFLPGIFGTEINQSKLCNTIHKDTFYTYQK